MQIEVAGAVVTQVADHVTNTVRDAVYGPLYPVAEWIATNWWSLLQEFASPRRIAADGYAVRHCLASSGEGFALPSLQFRPEGKRVLITWSRASLPECRLSFLSQGTASLDRDVVEETLRSFISAVLRRLDDQGVQETLLAEEWKTICETEPDEREFCEAAGTLGWDPYALDATSRDTLLDVAGCLPAQLLEEFLAAADPDSIKAD